jgi:ABC-2 type transport system ATP-binding protein
VAPQIQLEGVSKRFVVHRRSGVLRRTRDIVTAVDDLSLDIDAGEIVGYIGPNGAGKSTTIKMLTGILAPSDGVVRVTGLDPQRDRMRLTQRIGVVFGQRSQLWWDLPLIDSFDLLRDLYRVPYSTFRGELAAFVDLLELAPFLSTPVRQLSLGQRMRGEITAALLHGPDVLYLDEPTIGLDIVSKNRVRGFLATVNRERGVTVLLTTHDLADVERLCRRLIVIDHGTPVFDGTVDQLKARFGSYRTLVVDLEDEAGPLDVPDAEVIRIEGPRQWLRFHRDEVNPADLVASIARTARLVDLTVEEPDIEDVVERIYASTRPEPR